jgi:hypothetical protein
MFAVSRRNVVFENTPLARRQWTGLSDEHLASIGFINFAWNAVERKFASLVWITGGWSQAVGELVVAGMGNVSLVSLFLDLLKHELSEMDDRRLWEQGLETGVLFDAIRDARNDVVHTFFDCDPMSGAEGHFKGAPRKNRNKGAEIRTVAMAKSDMDELCRAISDCFESIDDLILKLWFRRRFLSGRPQTPAHGYDEAVHGWQRPPFDLGRLKAFPEKRARNGKALRFRVAVKRADGLAADRRPLPRDADELSEAAESSVSPSERVAAPRTALDES